MRARMSVFAAAPILLSLIACSHNVTTELPTAPTPRPPKVLKLTITPTGGAKMIAGTTATITSEGPLPSSGAALGAFAQYDDGSGKYVEAAWSSSNAGVIEVANGTFTAVARGTAVITASFEALSATETFIVDPGIAGRWGGTYVVDNCQADTAAMYELICLAPSAGRQGGILPIGTPAPMAMQITASGPVLSAAAQFGEVRGTLTGTDRGQNLLTLKGDFTSKEMTISVVYWDAVVKQDAMEGYIAFELRVPGMQGFAGVTAHLAPLARQ